jgi:GAF domain-containing protein
MTAPFPLDEPARLEALERYRVLDTDAESSFDDLTLLAAQICSTPIALVSLLDRDRQWFKSRLGVPHSETPRDIAFCAHAILQPDVMVVEDALADERFSSNPLVTGEAHIRFYAGAPLFTPAGQAIGTICVLDRVPRRLDAGQIESLRALGRQTRRSAARSGTASNASGCSSTRIPCRPGSTTSNPSSSSRSTPWPSAPMDTPATSS